MVQKNWLPDWILPNMELKIGLVPDSHQTILKVFAVLIGILYL